MANYLMSAGEMAEVYAWLANSDSPSGVTAYRVNENRNRILSTRCNRKEHGIRLSMRNDGTNLEMGGR